MVPVGLAIGSKLDDRVVAVQRGEGLAVVGEIDADEAWDIDEELDFAICDFLLTRRQKNE